MSDLNYVVVITHNFDTETRVIDIGDDLVTAQKYLRWVWEEYYNEELSCGSKLKQSACWFQDDDALITWEDGCYTKFEIGTTYKPEEAFLKQCAPPANNIRERVVLTVGPEETCLEPVGQTLESNADLKTLFSGGKEHG